jgi:hypothetical protein
MFGFFFRLLRNYSCHGYVQENQTLVYLPYGSDFPTHFLLRVPHFLFHVQRLSKLNKNHFAVAFTL